MEHLNINVTRMTGYACITGTVIATTAIVCRMIVKIVSHQKA